MTGDNTDNPYAPPEPVEEETPYVVETNLSTLYRVLHFALLTWAVPMFLYFLLNPILFWCTAPLGVFVLVQAIAFPFVVAYIGMMFHKIWAFVLCVIYACLWTVVQPIITTDADNFPPGEELPFEGLFVVSAFYGVSVLVLSLILLAMTLRRKLHKH